jgi:hypothetical protein
MKGKQKPKREPKKIAGVFGERKKLNRYRRKWNIAYLLGGIEHANKVVGLRK